MTNYQAPSRATPNTHQRSSEKLARIPVKVEQTETRLPKPDWIRIKLPSGSEITQIKKLLRESQLHTVCEEAACPNLAECFQHGTATFMIMGDLCTRRCPFCDVAHGKPAPLDKNEPRQLAEAVQKLALKYVVVTSVNRDDLRDGGQGILLTVFVKFARFHPKPKLKFSCQIFAGAWTQLLIFCVFGHVKCLIII